MTGIWKICSFSVLFLLMSCQSNKMVRRTGIYTSYAELANSERKGVDYEIRYADRGSSILIAAIHGGGIEPGTEELALAIAGSDYNYYLFSGIREKNNFKLHLTSELFDEPYARKMISASHYTILLHGFEAKEEMIYLGGLDKKLVEILSQNLQEIGFPVRTDQFIEFTGTHPENICNANKRQKGVQIELSAGLRQTMFASFSRSGRQSPTKRFHHFMNAIRASLATVIEDQ